MTTLIIWLVMAIVGWVNFNDHIGYIIAAVIGTVMLLIRIGKGFNGDGDFFEDLIDSGSDIFDGGSSSSGGGGSWGDD